MIVYFKQFFGLALLPSGLASLGLVNTGDGIGSRVGIRSIRNLLFLYELKKWRGNQNHILKIARIKTFPLLNFASDSIVCDQV